MADQRDFNGHEVFINVEGVPVHTPTIYAKNIIRRVQRFPTYLLGFSNDMIGRIMERAFEPVAPSAWTTLFWVQEIQLVEIALQNKLAQEPGAVLSGLDYNNFVSFKKSTIILLCLWERAYQNHFDQVYVESS